jgi:hypothetical protein
MSTMSICKGRACLQVLVATGADDYQKAPNPDAAIRQATWICLVVAVSALFAGYYGMHAVISANAFELLTFFATTAALIARHLVAVGECSEDTGQIGRSSSQEQYMCYGFMGTSIFLCIFNMVLVVFMYPDLLWKKYKAIGAEVSTRKLYRQYEIFMAVRKLDVQFSIVTLITGLIFFTFNNEYAHVATAVNAVMVLIEVVWDWLGYAAIHQENQTAMYFFWATSLFLPMFIINVAVQHVVLLRYIDYEPILIAVCIFAILTILNRAATVLISIGLYKNFGTKYAGLRRILQGGGALEKFEKVRLNAELGSRTPVPSVVSNPLNTAAPLDADNLLDSERVVIVESLAPSRVPSARPSVAPTFRADPSFYGNPSNADEYMEAVDRYIATGKYEDVTPAEWGSNKGKGRS